MFSQLFGASSDFLEHLFNLMLSLAKFRRGEN